MSAFYWKNLPVWERIGRALIAIATAVVGFAVFGSGFWGWLIALSAIGFGLTGKLLQGTEFNKVTGLKSAFN